MDNIEEYETRNGLHVQSNGQIIYKHTKEPLNIYKQRIAKETKEVSVEKKDMTEQEDRRKKARLERGTNNAAETHRQESEHPNQQTTVKKDTGKRS